MEALDPTINTTLKQFEEEFKQLELHVPKESWLANTIHFYQDFWCLDFLFKGIVASQSYFQAHDIDVVLASLPKTGTTWLKSLAFTIINRKKTPVNCPDHPLRTTYPHQLIPQLETLDITKIIESQPNLPRAFGTHIPYPSLSKSMKSSKCKIIYIYRNPLDTFISSWHFFLEFDIKKEIKPTRELFEEYFNKFCKGVSPYGPYDKHVLGYWNESLKNPEKVLFLEYEVLKKDPKSHLRRLAEFLGCPFSDDEEENGKVIDEIIEFCSFESLKEMEVNKNGKTSKGFDKKAIFRKGEVGDWTNYLTPTMINQIGPMKENLKKAGFSFESYPI